MLTAHDRVRISAQAVVCERTVKRVYRGAGTPYSRERVRRAAAALNLPPPPEPHSPAGAATRFKERDGQEVTPKL